MKIQALIVLLPIFIMCVVFMLFAISSCTISFQNISTHGMAEDLVDENQSPTNDISPNLSIPVKPL